MSSIEELLQKKPKTNKDFTLKVKIKKRAVKDHNKKIEELKLQRKNVESKDSKESDSKEPTLQIKQTGKIVDLTNKGFDRENFMKQFKDYSKVVLSPIKINKPFLTPIKIVFKLIKKLPNKILLTDVRKDRQPRKGRTRAKRDMREIDIPEGMVSISEFRDRLPDKAESVKLPTSKFFLNNREKFINFINSFYSDYKKELTGKDNITCEQIAASKKAGVFNLLTHQKIIRDYINLKTPYRGLLLYHGLGAGKTCGSVAIAEGIKTTKKIIIMAPASLIPNYKGELKFCGDQIYKLKQYWEFIKTDGNSLLEDKLSTILSLNKSFVRKQKGAWLVNVTKESNFKSLSSNEKLSLNKQIEKMMEHKYQFIGYNGYRMERLRKDSNDFTENPFSNKVIIVDEAHNLVSRIVNKINKQESLSYKLYDYLMSAENCKLVLLTGTPIINYPNEIGIMFNILRGYIKTFKIKLTVKTSDKVTLNSITQILKPLKLVDYIEYNANLKSLTITRNPFGFISNYRDSTYKGVELDEAGNISDFNFIELINKTLYNPVGKKSDYITFNVNNDVQIENYKTLPDKLDEFNTLFTNSDNTVKNPELFKKRIIGLTSYFRSAQESLMPTFNIDKNLHILKIDMHDYQLGIYQDKRDEERTQQKRNAKKAKNPGLYDQSTSTYRIFSRAACNFVFPEEIKRPMPNKSTSTKDIVSVNEDDIDAIPIEERRKNIDIELDEEELKEDIDDSYNGRIKAALDELRARQDEFLHVDQLERYSPKFLELYNNIVSEKNKGLHLIYSQFKTLEGIGIFKLVLESNGFAEFKIKKTAGVYELDIQPGDEGKPMFASYTGDEDTDEKEILRWIFNSEWDKIPVNIRQKLEEISSNNYYGEIVKVFMITASGAEGITLKNTRFVHIMEPYWHPVRVEQVIGRARRICSHEALEEEHKTVDVYLYLMKFSEEQIKSESKLSIETKNNDLSKLDNKTFFTTDESLWEISSIKEAINRNILFEVKESSIDCNIHNNADNQEKLKCFSFGKADPNSFSSNPNYNKESKDDVDKINKRQVVWKAKKGVMKGRTYAIKQTYDSNKKKWTILRSKENNRFEVYDYDSYKQLEKTGTGKVNFVAYSDGKRFYDDP
jgi:hypothetical protein